MFHGNIVQLCKHKQTFTIVKHYTTDIPVSASINYDVLFVCYQISISMASGELLRNCRTIRYSKLLNLSTG